MQQCVRAGKPYWGGLHRTLGVLIYDKNCQRGLSEDKIRLYIVNEKRLVTFGKARVFIDLVPTHLETWWCRTHEVVMKPWHNVKGTWWSHQVADGTWCAGQAKPTKATAPARPSTLSEFCHVAEESPPNCKQRGWVNTKRTCNEFTKRCTRVCI